MKPKILLSANTKMQNYVDAVEACGGIADARYCPETSLAYDGLILCGGNDIHPRYYGEAFAGAREIDEARDAAEFSLVRAYLAAGKPILGICRGMQLLNIALGGNLIQHIGNAAWHTSPDCDLVHEVQAVRGSVCESLYGEYFAVNSAHHQAVKVPGKGLRVTVYAGDTVEAYEHERLPLLGVQWHPERMCVSQRRDDTVDGAPLIRYFVQLCRGR